MDEGIKHTLYKSHWKIISEV